MIYSPQMEESRSEKLEHTLQAFFFIVHHPHPLCAHSLPFPDLLCALEALPLWTKSPQLRHLPVSSWHG